MKGFLKRLFCFHKYKYKVLFTPAYLIKATCLKCGKTKQVY